MAFIRWSETKMWERGFSEGYQVGIKDGSREAVEVVKEILIDLYAERPAWREVLEDLARRLQLPLDFDTEKVSEEFLRLNMEQTG